LVEISEQDRIFGVGTDEDLKAGLKKAKTVLLSSGMVAFPTESFYGLAVNALDEEAIQRLFAVKKRQDDNPLLVLIPSIDVLDHYVSGIPDIAHRLIKQFWPGGLTLIFKAGPKISPLLTAGTGKIGIRLSSHPIATALASEIDLPITGTSANISGQPACMTAGEVFHSLGMEVDLILNGGQTKGGKGSTILDVTISPPEILREGMVGREQLKQFILTSN
jgi:L-threonylcarbamoyladenylate synthase